MSLCTRQAPASPQTDSTITRARCTKRSPKAAATLFAPRTGTNKLHLLVDSVMAWAPVWVGHECPVVVCPCLLPTPHHSTPHRKHINTPSVQTAYRICPTPDQALVLTHP